MKKSFILALIILFAANMHAQLFEMGLRAGVNLHHVKIKDFDQAQFKNFSSEDRKMGFHGGVYGRFNLPVIFIQPELLYTFQNGEIMYEESTGGTPQSIKFNYSRFDIPLIIGARMGPLRLGLGPLASFAISSPADPFKKSLKDASYGYQIGFGLDIGKKLRIEARYEGALGQIAESVTIDGTEYPTDVRLSQYLFGLGYKLF